MLSGFADRKSPTGRSLGHLWRLVAVLAFASTFLGKTLTIIRLCYHRGTTLVRGGSATLDSGRSAAVSF
jgi:hypothetical protein